MTDTERLDWLEQSGHRAEYWRDLQEPWAVRLRDERRTMFTGLTLRDAVDAAMVGSVLGDDTDNARGGE